jgi:hypothetical protein
VKRLSFLAGVGAATATWAAATYGMRFTVSGGRALRWGYFRTPALTAWVEEWLPIVGAMTVALLVCHLLMCRRSRPRQPACRRCGYYLHGLTQPRCPECGEWV